MRTPVDVERALPKNSPAKEWWFQYDEHGNYILTNGVEVHFPDLEEGSETMPDSDVFLSPTPKSKAMPPLPSATEPEKGKIQVRIQPYVATWTHDKVKEDSLRNDWTLTLDNDLDFDSFAKYLKKKSRAPATIDLRTAGVHRNPP